MRVVDNREMGIKRAALQFGVPRTTLKDSQYMHNTCMLDNNQWAH